MKLLRSFTATGAVFFPVGLPPKGTCEFATSACLKYCYAVDSNDLNFDEEIRISEEEKREIYRIFMTHPAEELAEKLLLDLDGLQTPILSWFGSGDCMTEDLAKIGDIVDVVGDRAVQMGFTRNVVLWERYPEIFALTIEDKKAAPSESGMYAVPKYEEQTSVMYSPSYQVLGGYCGPMTCKDRDLERTDIEHYINCKTCRRLRTGCFDRRF